MKRRAKISLFPALFLFALLLFTFHSPDALGNELTGSWQNDLYMSPQSSSISAYESTLDVKYSVGGVNLASESVYTRDKFYSQKFGLDYRLGILDVGSTLSLDPSDSSLKYWLNEGKFSLAGIRFDTKLLLEYMESRDDYGSGVEFGVSGNLGDGVGIEIKTHFGMEVDEAEALGLEEGSGFDIVTRGIQTNSYGPSQLQYVDTEIDVTGLSLGCCTVDMSTDLSEELGFDNTELEFQIGGDESPVIFDVDLEFKTQTDSITKTVELDPSLRTDWGCFDVFTSLSTPDAENLLTGSTSTIDAINIDGYGISNVTLGYVTFSSITALNGNLYRPHNTYNIDLRATDYLIEPPQKFAFLFKETDYDEIVSLVKSSEGSNLSLGVDFYFDMDADEVDRVSMFNVALVTGEADFQVSDQFSLGAGVAIKPVSVETMRLSFNYYF